ADCGAPVLEGDRAGSGTGADRGSEGDGVTERRRIRGGSKNGRRRGRVNGLGEGVAGACEVTAVTGVNGGEAMAADRKRTDGEGAGAMAESGCADGRRAVLERDGACCPRSDRRGERDRIAVRGWIGRGGESGRTALREG